MGSGLDAWMDEYGEHVYIQHTTLDGRKEWLEITDHTVPRARSHLIAIPLTEAEFERAREHLLPLTTPLIESLKVGARPA